jgi:hypothetical protein
MVYAFQDTFGKTCIMYEPGKRSCPLVTLIDAILSIMFRFNLLLIVTFWAEFIYHLIKIRDVNSQKSSTFIHYIYWSLHISVQLLCITISSIMFGLELWTYAPRFIIGFFITFDIIIPIIFLIFAYTLYHYTRKRHVDIYIIVKRVIIIAMIMGIYFTLNTIIRICSITYIFLYGTDSRPALSNAIIFVTHSIVLEMIPGIVVSCLALAPLRKSNLRIC